jgi:adenylate cyclase
MLSLTLRFSAEQEAQFQEDYLQRTLPVTRLALITGAVMYAALAALDPFAMAQSYTAIWLIRLAVVGSILAMVGFTFTELGRKHSQWLVTLATLSAGGGVGAMMAMSQAAEPGHQHYYSGLILIFLFTAAFTRLRFGFATLCLALATAVYMGVEATQVQVATEAEAVTRTVQWAFLALSAVTASAIAYFLETFSRQSFLDRKSLEAERNRSESLLLNVLPGEIAEELKTSPGTIVRHIPECTLLFADIVGFTPMVSNMSPRDLVHLLNGLFTEIDEIVERHGVEKIKTIGDCYMIAAGVPAFRADHAEVIAQIALEIQQVVRRAEPFASRQLALRMGIHSGPVVAGIIGRKKFVYDLWGDTVNTASRLESHGKAGKIQISAETYQRLRSKYRCVSAGAVELKGRGPVDAFYLVGPLAEAGSGKSRSQSAA